VELILSAITAVRFLATKEDEWLLVKLIIEYPFQTSYTFQVVFLLISLSCF